MSGYSFKIVVSSWWIIKTDVKVISFCFVSSSTFFFVLILFKVILLPYHITPSPTHPPPPKKKKKKKKKDRHNPIFCYELRRDAYHNQLLKGWERGNMKACG